MSKQTLREKICLSYQGDTAPCATACLHCDRIAKALNIDSSAILETVADAIDAARFAHPQNPRERPRAFVDADPSDREYAIRLARAALAAI